MATLAIEGGDPFRKHPFPSRTPFGDEEIGLLTQAVRSQNLFGPTGTMVGRFEDRFADLYGAKHAVGSSSGTAAMHIAVGTIDPNPGDEIITAPITDAGSIVPIVYQNAIPIFADVDATYNMDPLDVEKRITSRTKAIMVVHLFGNPCDMDAMTDIARRHGLSLIEDCSQAHLTDYKGRLLGTFGDIAAFSLQQSKHMTTGDGGMTLTNDDDLAARMKLFQDKGWTRKPGWGARSYAFLSPNYRMTELQGAVGLAQTDKVRGVVAKRGELGDYLSSLLGCVGGVSPAPVTPGGRHSYWAYPLRVSDWPVRRFAEALEAEGVSSSPGYIGEPIFLCMDALAGKKTFGASQHPFDGCHGGRRIEYARGMCPAAEEALDHMLVIGFNENYSRRDIEDITGAVGKVAGGLAERSG